MPFRRTSWTGSGTGSVSAACRTVLQLIDRCETAGVLYADPVMGQLSDLTFALLLTKFGVRWEYRRMEGICEIVWPPICGIHLLQLNPDQSPQERRFALRHAFGHVLAGHCRDSSYAHDGHHWSTYEERVADGFALIDLLSDVAIRDRLAAGWSWRDLMDWILGELRAFGPTWEWERTYQRTEERLWLYVEREGSRQEVAR